MKLSIPKPCHEKWEDMNPVENGRFCSVCSKTVRDFTGLSDREVMEELGETSNICGNFNANQLGRDLNFSFINSLFSKFAIGFVLTSGGIVSINAQESRVDKVTHKTLLINEETAKIKKVSDVAFRGAIRSDYNNYQPLYILDGEIIDDKIIKDIDLNLIEKLEVLKGDTAISLFGSKGKNGVVLMTTKKKFRKEKAK